MNVTKNRVSVVLGCALLTLTVAFARQPAAPADLAAAIQHVDALAAEEFGKDPVAGLTVGIVAGPTLVWTKSYGFADMESKRPASADTVYRIGSITKQFTALMLLQLVEQGKVHLTDPVEKYLPEINKVAKHRPDAPPITLVQLATMTSGLAREPSGPSDHSVGPVSQWEQKVLTSLPLTTYAFEPGTHYLYSNIGYASLGVALGRAAGQPFTTYVEEKILTPLGMTTTAFTPTDRIRANFARGYTVRNGKPDPAAASRELEGRGYRVPNGALMSTVGDLAKFLSFELGEGPWIIKKETQDDNFSRTYSATGALNSGYGIGFQSSRRGTLVAIGHGGSTAGFLSAALVDRVSKTGVIVLRNADGGGGRLNPTSVAMRALEVVAAARARTSTPAR
jgi:CubicO group peptidase (beta-lactamase class C family)